MIPVQSIDSIAAVENLYTSVSRLDAAQQLQLATHIRGDVLGSRAALLQFIITWTKAFPKGQLLTHISAGSEAKVKLGDLCAEEHGIVSLLMTSNIAASNGAPLTEEARLAARRSYFESFQQPRQKGNRLLLLVCDHLGPTDSNLPFLQLSVPPRVDRKRRFLSFYRQYLRSCFRRVNAPPFRQDTGERLAEIVYELFANTEEWGSVQIDGTPLPRSVRGVFAQVHVPQAGKPLILQNVERDPGHFAQYLSRFPEFSRGEGALLELSVFDSGQGFVSQWQRKPFTEAMSLNDEYDAVVSCLGRHASSSDVSTRGLGLFSVMQLLSRTRGYLRFRGGRLALYRDFARTPHPFASRREATPIVGDGEFRKMLELLFDWSTGSEEPQPHGYAEGALVSVWIPLLEKESQLDLSLP